MNHFISFADSRMTDSLNRLCRQAEALEFFDETTSFTEHDLLPEFTSRMGKYLTPSCKGFGYWSWKPWIISHALQKMKDGDRLLYLDAGCHINPAGMKRFREYWTFWTGTTMACWHFTMDSLNTNGPRGTSSAISPSLRKIPASRIANKSRPDMSSSKKAPGR